MEEKVYNPKAYLDKQPKRKIKINKTKNEKLNTIAVTYNGYNIQIPVGEEVNVPELIAKILEDRGII